MYYSQQSTKAEAKYHTYELEILAIIRALQRFRYIRHTLRNRDLVSRIARWFLLLQEYAFDLQYRSGRKMEHVDTTSRNPVDLPNTKDQNTVADVSSFRAIGISEEDWVRQLQMQEEKIRASIGRICEK